MLNEVTKQEFFGVIKDKKLNVHPTIVGNFPYTSIFEFPNGVEFGRVVDSRDDGVVVSRYYIKGVCTPARRATWSKSKPAN